MEKFVKNLFALLAIIVIAIIKAIVRIPVFAFLAVYILVGLLIVEPLFHLENPKWVNNLYDWYCNK